MPEFSSLQRHGHQHSPRLVRSDAAIPFDYTLVRSTRRTLAVYIRSHGVEVRTPLHSSEQEIKCFISTNLRWIVRKLDERQQQQKELLHVRNGGEIFYKARTLNIRFVETTAVTDQTPDIRAGTDTLTIHGHKLTPEKAKKLLEKWLLIRAKAILPARTRALAYYLQLDDRLKEVVFRKTRSKWGHCTSAGRIQYNPLIMLTPDAIIDYMICHETCHLRHLNHSTRYWQLVASVCPDYRYYMAWLKRHEHRFWPVDQGTSA
ncbi:MAG: SprT family zinc-dependent metalloprotease [Pseudomonadales bacterium]|nr:SprT family zinc-dependent metalloprotease [Pseudomonadales bacterium]